LHLQNLYYLKVEIHLLINEITMNKLCLKIWSAHFLMWHPEVTYVGFLTSLYAGTPSLYSSKYSFLNGIVKKLEQ